MIIFHGHARVYLRLLCEASQFDFVNKRYGGERMSDSERPLYCGQEPAEEISITIKVLPGPGVWMNIMERLWAKTLQNSCREQVL